MSEPEIVVDSREPWEQVIEYLTDFGATNTRLDTLNANSGHPKADYIVDSGMELAIQRKTCNDFVGSLDSLKDDLYELRTAHEASALLIEGSWRNVGSQVGLRRGKEVVPVCSLDTWHNFILSQQLRGTMYIQTMGLSETCMVLVNLASYLNGDWSPPTSKVDDPSLLLQMLPGVGPTLAGRIIDQYGDVLEALQWIDTWADEVDGVGPTTNERVLNHLTE